MSALQPYSGTFEIEEVESEFVANLNRCRVLRGKTVCRAKLLDVARLHHVSFERRSGKYTQEFYLDDYDQREAFIVDAIGALCQPGEDPNAMRQEFRQLLQEKFDAYVDSYEHLRLERMSEAIQANIEWLWPGYIAADKLSILVGDPGIGKSLVSLDIAARVSTGQLWPGEPDYTWRREPGSVVLLAEMDDSADTIRPRLNTLGADLDRVHLLRTYVRVGENGASVLPFSMAGNLDMLAACLRRVRDCKLVIIDPLSLYVEGAFNRRQVTELLGNLVELAVSKRVAVLVVSHFGKGLFQQSSQMNSRFVAAAQTVWRIVGDRQDRSRRFLLPMKNNLGRDYLGLAFRIESSENQTAARVVWENQPLEIAVERTTFDPESPKLISSRRAQRESACEWLRNQLLSGAKSAQDILAQANAHCIAEKSIRRALREIGGMTRKGENGHWVWTIPGAMSRTDSCANDNQLCQLGYGNGAAKLAKLAKMDNCAGLETVTSDSGADILSAKKRQAGSLPHDLPIPPQEQSAQAQQAQEGRAGFGDERIDIAVGSDRDAEALFVDQSTGAHADRRGIQVVVNRQQQLRHHVGERHRE
jgi:putative DNA primase/helicase